MRKRIISIFVVLTMILSMVVNVYADEVTTITWDDEKEVEASQNYLALGADLSPEQLGSVLGMMGLSYNDLASYNVVYINNAMEHQYLGEYVAADVIGHRSLSSVLVRPREEGHGVQVKTINITYCTEGMYKNALLTAGVKNADIIVVGPTPISGTAALIGALKAYEEMSGEQVSEQTMDTAMNELVTTGEIADSLGDADQVEEIIAIVKAEIAEKDLDTREDIEKVVRECAEKYNTNLNEEEINKIIDLMVKIKEMGIDYNTLIDQAADLYSKYGDSLLNPDGTLSSEAKGEIIKKAAGSFIDNLFKKVGEFFKGLFGK